MTALSTRLRRLAPSSRWQRWGLVVLYVELLVVAWYVALSAATITDPLVLVYPLVWINVGLWVFVTTTIPRATRRNRVIGLLVAVAYFGVLSYAGGVVGPAVGPSAGLRVAWPLPPGWGPALIASGRLLQVVVIPYQVAGYLALTYLVYATLLESIGSVVSGVVGLFSCVSCTWPVLGTVLAGLLGSGSAVTAIATNQPYTASTIVFLSAVALLRYRPWR